jgi:hypothetical protein
MNLSAPTHSEPWMTPQEREINQELIQVQAYTGGDCLPRVPVRGRESAFSNPQSGWLYPREVTRMWHSRPGCVSGA